MSTLTKFIILFFLLIILSFNSIPNLTTADNLDQVKVSDLINYNIENNNYDSNPKIIAVIDTGIDLKHPEFNLTLTNKIWTNIEEIDGNPGIDDDQNGYIDDINGWNFVDNSNDIQDDNSVSHGTHTAGTVVSDFTGTSPQSQVMVLKAFDSTGDADFDSVAHVIHYAVDMGADIISMSLGGTTTSQSLNDAVEYAKNNEIIMVAAAGNAGTSFVDYPARLDGVFAVGSVDQFYQRSSFSNFGDQLDLMAPGENVNSSVQTGSGYSSLLYINGIETKSYAMKFSDYTAMLDSYIMKDGGTGSIAEFERIQNPNNMTMVLIERGSFDFATLAQRVSDIGAKGMIVYNNEPGIFVGSLQSNYGIVAVSISREDGLAVKETLSSTSAGGAVEVKASDYYLNSGTSMATPLVAGVIAELLYAGVSYDEIEQYLKFGSYDPFDDQVTQKTDSHGYGIINGSRLVTMLEDVQPPVFHDQFEYLVLEEQILFNLTFTENFAIDYLNYSHSFSNNGENKSYQFVFNNPDIDFIQLGLDKTINQRIMDVVLILVDARGWYTSIQLEIEFILGEGFSDSANLSYVPIFSMTILISICRKRKIL